MSHPLICPFSHIASLLVQFTLSNSNFLQSSIPKEIEIQTYWWALGYHLCLYLFCIWLCYILTTVFDLNIVINTDLMPWKLKFMLLTSSVSQSGASLFCCVLSTALSALCCSLGFSWALFVGSCKLSESGCFSTINISSQRLGIFLALMCHATELTSSPDYTQWIPHACLIRSRSLVLLYAH